MVAANPRDREVRRLLTEVRLNRSRMIRGLAQDYRPTFDRLNSAYRGAVAGITEVTDNYDGSSRSQTRLLNRIRSELRGMETIVSEESGRLQTLGIQTGGRVGVQNMNAGGMSVRFNETTREALQGAIDYVDSDPFREAVNKYAGYHTDRVSDIILTATNQGVNPRQTARLALRYFEQSKNPLADATRLTRTTQIYASRVGANEVYKRTGIESWIWIANIGDSRTCLSCIAQHGTVHPVDEILNDHHNGRCAPAPVTPKWADLGLADGNDPVIETGTQWFNKQPGDVQAQLMGPELFEAFQRGEFEFTPDVISGTYNNPIFGDMRRRRTNAEILRGGAPRGGGNTPRRPTDPFSGPSRPTINGYMPQDVGSPGDTEESLLAFMRENGEDSPLSGALWSQELGLVGYDDDFNLRVNPQGVKDAAKAFVAENRDISYGRDYLLDIVREQASDNGVTGIDAELLLNDFYKTRAQAIQLAANASNTRLTEAQITRLGNAINGDYLNSVYTTNSSENGSLANRIRTTKLKGAELQAARNNFNEWVNGIDF